MQPDSCVDLDDSEKETLLDNPSHKKEHLPRYDINIKLGTLTCRKYETCVLNIDPPISWLAVNILLNSTETNIQFESSSIGSTALKI